MHDRTPAPSPDYSAPSLMLGLTLGQMQSTVAQHGRTIARLERELGTVKERLRRLLILAALWAAALGANASTEQLAKVLAQGLALAFRGLKLGS